MSSSLNKIKKYHKCELHKEFDLWLKINAKKFKYPPYLFKTSAQGVQYKFEGVIGEVRLCLNSYGNFMVTYSRGNRIEELIVEFDSFEEKTKFGNYYCGILLPRYRRYHSSKSSLFVTHCFRPLLKWANDNFLPEKSLIVLEYKDHWGVARIMDTSTANRKKKYVKFRSPVIAKRESTKINLSIKKKSRWCQLKIPYNRLIFF